MTDYQWEEITGSSEGDVWDFETHKEFIGSYQGTRENVGPNKQKLHSFRDENDTPYVIWGSALIDSRMATAQVGDMMRIVYLGKAVSEKTKRSYHNFQIFKARKGEM